MTDQTLGLVQSLLVLGGARSGKSRYAQKLAEASGKKPFLIATAQVRDEEMAARIAQHRAERARHWRVAEEAFDLAGALASAAAPDTIIVVDCLTLWLSNLMLAAQDIEAAGTGLIKSLAQAQGPVIFVSNEVGQGIVPDNQLARAFRDAQGRLNQALAAECEAVVLMVAGLALQVKPDVLAPRR